MKARQKKLNVTIVDDSHDLAAAAIKAFLACAAEAIEARGRFCTAISSDMPPAFYKLLRDSYAATDLQWDKVHLFRVDLCCGPACPANPSQEPSPWRLVRKIGMPPGNVHGICAGRRNCGCVASLYEHTIYDVVRARKNRIPSFDMILLAMRPDGHIASLFNDTYAFFDADRCVRVIHFMDARKTRITLTNHVLRAAAHLVVIVCGQDKAPILKDILTSEPDEVRYPLHAVWPILDRVTWLVDRHAGSLLLPRRRPHTLIRPYSQPSRFMGGHK